MNVTGTDADLNTALERANRVADFMEFGELLALRRARARGELRRRTSASSISRRTSRRAERRSEARRCSLLPRRGVGIRGTGSARRCALEEPLDVREREAGGAEL